MLKADYHRALRKAAVAHGRWCKTARTHFNAEHGGARWATDSELTASGSASSNGCRRPTTSASS